MYKQAEQSKRNKNKALDDSVTQKKHNGKQGFEFMDNRQEAIYQARMKEIGNRVLPGANTQMKSKEHSNGCCCLSCSNSHKALQAKKIMSSGTIQRFTTVSIEDNLGNRVDGKSGNESSTRSAFAGWPELRSSFERNVHPVDMPVLDEEGNATKETYSRNGYMCAEPNALSSLLHKYNVVKHPLDNKWLADINFPNLAVDNKTGQKIKPCPVCSQWVSDTIPMKIKGLDGGSFTNNAQLEHKKEMAHEEFLSQERDAQKKQVKEQKAQEKQRVESLQVTRRKVIEVLQGIDAKAVFALIEPISIAVAEKWDIYKTPKKRIGLKEINLKKLTDECISDWVNKLDAINVYQINSSKKFLEDEGYRNDFKQWAVTNLELITES